MSVFKRIMFFFVLPVLGTLFYQPSMLSKASSVLSVVGIIFLGWRTYFGAAIQRR